MSKLKIEVRKRLHQTMNMEFGIFEQGKTNANYITDYYMRTPTTGTYYKRIVDDPENEERANTWELLHKLWREDGSPPDQWFWPQANILFKVLRDPDGTPVFHHHHGWLFMPWQLKVHHAPQPEITIIGGFGTGKTALIAMSLAVCAATIPNFRGYAVAPQMIQANEVYRYLKTHAGKETLWNQRFLWREVSKPNPMFELRASHLGEGSTIEILSIESDPEKVRTLEGDVIFLDQAEKFDDLDDLTIDLGSRLRGMVHGRPRLGRLVYVANAGHSPSLWQRYNMMEEDPVHYYSISPSSLDDNIYLTEKDKKNLIRRVGGTEKAVDQWLRAKQPEGKGEHFPAAMVEKCTDHDLAKWIEEMADREKKGEPGKAHYDWAFDKNQESGLYHYEMPPDFDAGSVYCVIGDPGQGNPPRRNAGVVGVWDITDFPEKPARMVAFHWIYGHGFYDPFLSEYTRLVKKYRAYGRNAFDSTGTQKGFDELYFASHKVHAMGMSMAGTGKNHALNAAKFLMGAAKLEWPYIPHLFNQMTNYVLPDTKIRQDITMMVAMTAWYLQMYFYIEIPEDEDGLVLQLAEDVPYERNTRAARSRSYRGYR